MIRDPLAELWAAAKPRGRSSASLTVPYKHPAGGFVWLSIGQWTTLLWLRRRMKYGHGQTTLAIVAAATGAHPGTVTHRLDRLAQLGLIGRHSRRGRGHRTRYWPARGRRGPGSWKPDVNVATSTAYGGPIRAYVSRAGVRQSTTRGGGPPQPPGGGSPGDGGGRRRPPRLIYERCPLDGGLAKLTAWRFSRTSTRLTAVWSGVCPRCSSIVLAPLVVDVDADRWAIPDRAGDVLAGIPAVLQLTGGRVVRRRTGSRTAEPPAAIDDAARLARLRDVAAEVIAGAEVDADTAGVLGARWLGWRPERIPQLDAIAVDPAGAGAARSAMWSAARDWRPVRYSQPTDDVDDPPTSVRDSQPAAGDVDG